MKKNPALLATILGLFCPHGYADDAVSTLLVAVKPENEFSFNLSGTSDYRYRGISQTELKPAIQGGADYTNNPTGFYVGAWLSSIKWVEDAHGNGNVEVDVYAGKRGEVVGDLSYDVGVLRYIYRANKLAVVPTFVNADTTELYTMLSYKLLNVKYSQATTNIFAFPNSTKSSYVDLWSSINLVDGYALGLHAGHQHIERSTDWSYTDYKVGIAKDFFDISWTLGVVGTNASKGLYVTPDGRFTGRTSLVLSATKAF